MKAVRLHEHGGPEVLHYEDAPDPRPGPGEVLLKVRATSLNHLDVFVRRGMPGVRIDLPRIPGADVSGTVAALGAGVQGWAEGDAVVINPGSSCGRCEFCTAGDASLCLGYKLLGESGDGAYAQYVAVPASSLFRLPAGADPVAMASVPLVFLTAWRMLLGRGGLQAGEDVLILGAGSGVGTAAVQIARQAGARVFAAASTQDKLRRAGELGAEVLIDYSRQDFAKEVSRLTDRRGVDVVVDYVGKDTWARSLRAVRRGGRVLTCGATTGYDPVEDLRHIFFRQVSVIGSTMGSNNDLAAVLRLMSQGRLKPVVDRVLPLQDAAEAHRLMESRNVFGKLVLEVGGD